MSSPSTKSSSRASVAFMLVVCLMCGGAAAAQPPQSGPASRPVKLKITISRQTTYVLGPVNADGTVDYLAAWNERMGKDAPLVGRNAFVPLLGIMNPAYGPWHDPELIGRIRARLPGEKIEKPAARRGEHFIDLFDFLASLPADQRAADNRPAGAGKPGALDEVEFQQVKAAGQGLWSARDYPVIAKWLTANDEPLARFAQAGELPQFYAPLVPDSPAQSTCLAGTHVLSMSPIFSKVTEAMVARAMLRFANGDLPGARADLLSLHRWARLMAQDPDLILRMLASGIDRTACQAEQAMAASGRLTAGQDRAMIRDLDRLADIPGLAGAIDGKGRMEMLDSVMVWAREGIERSVWGSQQAQGWAGAMRDGRNPTTVPWAREPRRRIALGEPDWDIALRVVNSLCDRQVAALSKPTYPARKAAGESLAAELQTLTGGKNEANLLAHIEAEARWAGDGDRQMLETVVRHVGEFLSVSLCRTHHKISSWVDVGAMQLRLTKVSLALAAYRADKGTYPKELKDLAPAYLPAVPADLFTDKPLVYKPAGGGYLLYSLGPNMQDDGGKERPDGGDDVVVQVGGAKAGRAKLEGAGVKYFSGN